MECRMRIIILSLVICLLFSLSGVCASELNDTTVTTADMEINDNDLTNSNPEDGLCEGHSGDFNALQNLIDNANENDVISLNRSYTFTSTLDDNFTKGIVINKTLTVDGNGYTIDAVGKARIFNIYGNGVKLTNITFINANSSSSPNNRGGAIHWDGANASLFNCKFMNNSDNYDGSAIYLNNGNATIFNCSFLNSFSPTATVCVYGFNNSIISCSFINCSSNKTYGGAIEWEGKGFISNCSFINCTNSKSGGAIYLWSGGYINNCSFINCSAHGGGGAIVVRYGNGTVYNCSFINCSSGSGGAIHIRGSNSSVYNCSFMNGHASITEQSGNGGAIYVFADNCSVCNCSFVNHYVKSNRTSYGGAISWRGNNGAVYGCSFVNNSAKYGGAIYWQGTNASISGCDFVNNCAGRGSAICLTDNCNISNSTFRNNKVNGTLTGVDYNNHELNFTFQKNNGNKYIGSIAGSSKINFDNITYLYNGSMVNSNTVPIVQSSDTYNDLNIIIEVYLNNILVDNQTIVTDDNGAALYSFYKLSKGNYTYNAYHTSERYISEARGSFTETPMTTFNDLQKLIDFSAEGDIVNLDNDITYTPGVDNNLTTGIVINKNLTINGNGYTIDAVRKARIFNIQANGVKLDNITFANGMWSMWSDGGAIHWVGNNDSLYNCIFVNCSASTYGGAIYLQGSNGTFYNCSFTNCSADKSDGAAVYVNGGNTNVLDCSFVNCISKKGHAAINWVGATTPCFIYNCSFVNCTSGGHGGAIFMLRNVNSVVYNCSFTNCFSGRNGGAIYLEKNANSVVYNCSFQNCSSQEYGGAIYCSAVNSSVYNCNFIGCFVKCISYYNGFGGAIYWGSDNCSVYNCSFRDCFVNNTYGGAICWAGANGVLYNCDFVNCSSNVYGGAIYWTGANGSLYNGSFVNCSADIGGAIYLQGSNASISNCDFVNNFATSKGSAIYFNSNGNISNSIFKYNKLKASLNSIDCNSTGVLNFTFNRIGENNYIDAIYSDNTINFDNVTYWQYGVMVNSNTVPVVQALNDFNRLNITVEVYCGDVLVDNLTVTTDDNGVAIYPYYKLDIGNYTYKAYHASERYIYCENTGNFTETPMKTFSDLQKLIDVLADGDIINLDNNITFTEGVDDNLSEGIFVNKNLTINGNGYTIDAVGKARIFKVRGNGVKLINITFANGKQRDGGAVFWTGASGSVYGCSFVNCSTNEDGGAIYWGGATGSVSNCSFVNCSSRGHGAAISVSGGNNRVFDCSFANCTSKAHGGAINFGIHMGFIYNCSFVNCSAKEGGAIYGGDYARPGYIYNCSFMNCSAKDYGGAILLKQSFETFVYNCSFIKCSAGSGCAISGLNAKRVSHIYNCSFMNCFSSKYGGYGGAILWRSSPEAFVSNCSFMNCSSMWGGAIGWLYTNGSVSNCSFMNCSADSGGAIFWGSVNGSVSNCSFMNCSSDSGGAISWTDVNGNIYNGSFVNCSAGNGGAIYWYGSNASISNCDFVNNFATSKGSAIYFKSNGNISNSIFKYNKLKASLNSIDCNSTGVLNFTFNRMGVNNYIDAIYSDNTINFANVTYWQYGVMVNSNTVPIVKSINNNYDGLIIIVEIYDGNTLVDNVSLISDDTGKVGYDYSHLSDGNYTYKVYHLDGGYYTYTESTGSFICKHIKPNITVTVSNVSYGNYPVVNLTSNVEGNYSLVVAGRDYGIYELNKNNNLNILIPVTELLNAGNDYVASVEFGGYSIYAPASANTTFSINQALSNFNVTSTESEYYYGQDIIFIVELPSDATGNVTFYCLNNVIGEIDDISKQKSLNLSIWNADTYTIQAKYGGDVNYKNSTKEFTFKVKASDNIIKVSVESVQYPDEVNVRVNATVDGVYVIDINGIKYNVTANGDGINLKLAADAYYANITNESTVNYNFITINTTFTVSKGINPVEVIVENKVLPGATNVTVRALIDGVYTVVINGTYSVDVNVSGGEGSASIDLPAGKLYLATTSFAHQNYTAEITNARFDVDKGINVINVTVSSVVYPDEVNVCVNATVDGIYVIDINGTKYNVTANGEGINVKLATGNYFANVCDYSSPYYEGVIKNTTFIVNKARSNVEAQVSDITYSEDVIVNVNASADGIVVVVIDDVINVSVNVSANVTLPVRFADISAGKHNVTVTLKPNNTNYSESVFNTNFTVYKKQTNVSLAIGDVIYPNKVVVNVSASEKGIVTVKIGENVKNINVEANVVTSIDFGVLNLGHYNVSCNFTAGDNFTDSQAIVSFRVLSEIKPGDINITIPEIIAGNQSNMTLNLPEDAGGNITLIIGNNTFIFEVINGVSNITIPPLDDGEYNYTIIYSGDEKYAPFEISDTLNVDKPTPEIVIPPVEEISNGKNITMNLPSDATGNLTVYVANQVFTQEVINGSATIKVTNLPVGKHTITIIYSGDKKYAESIQNTTITVVVAPRIVMGLSEVLYTGDYSVTVYGKDAKVCANADVIFYINGKMVKTTKTDSNGVAVFKLPKSCVSKKYNIQVTSLGQVAFKILKVKHILTIKSVKVKKSAKKLILKAALKKLNGKYLKGKKITLKIKGKKVASGKTNKKGVVTFKVKNKQLKKFKKGKKYKVTVSYAKDVVSKKIKIVK